MKINLFLEIKKVKTHRNNKKRIVLNFKNNNKLVTILLKAL